MLPVPTNDEVPQLQSADEFDVGNDGEVVEADGQLGRGGLASICRSK